MFTVLSILNNEPMKRWILPMHTFTVLASVNGTHTYWHYSDPIVCTLWSAKNKQKPKKKREEKMLECRQNNDIKRNVYDNPEQWTTTGIEPKNRNIALGEKTRWKGLTQPTTNRIPCHCSLSIQLNRFSMAYLSTTTAQPQLLLTNLIDLRFGSWWHLFRCQFCIQSGLSCKFT